MRWVIRERRILASSHLGLSDHMLDDICFDEKEMDKCDTKAEEKTDYIHGCMDLL